MHTTFVAWTRAVKARQRQSSRRGATVASLTSDESQVRII
jgi:hypothetical protein